MESVIILILFAAVLSLAGRYYVLKKQIKSIFRQLHGEQTKLVTVELVDRDIEMVAQEINGLINDFFELSVIESQGCTPKLENVDVAGMLCEQILASYPIFEGKGIIPHFEDLDKPIFVSADFNMLNRVIQNLISNGVKYTIGELCFCICQEYGQVIMTVSNPINTYVDVEHIFDRFFTQDKSRSKGSGIGLYVCRQFIEAMGGRINAELIEKRLSVKVVLNSAKGQD